MEYHRSVNWYIHDNHWIHKICKLHINPIESYGIQQTKRNTNLPMFIPWRWRWWNYYEENKLNRTLLNNIPARIYEIHLGIICAPCHQNLNNNKNNNNILCWSSNAAIAHTFSYQRIVQFFFSREEKCYFNNDSNTVIKWWQTDPDDDAKPEKLFIWIVIMFDERVCSRRIGSIPFDLMFNDLLTLIRA